MNESYEGRAAAGPHGEDVVSLGRRSEEQEYGPGNGVTQIGNDGRFVHYNTFPGNYIFEVTTDQQ